MKYKRLYLEAQKKFADRISDLELHFSDIRHDIIGIQYAIDARRDEISPELYIYLTATLNSLNRKCLHKLKKDEID